VLYLIKKNDFDIKIVNIKIKMEPRTPERVAKVLISSNDNFPKAKDSIK
jgi:hypothetical protein